MRRTLQFSVLLLAVGVVNACRPEEVIKTEDIPTAGVRFLNAVPDTIGFDFRPVDIVENTTFYGITFRNTTQLYYKNAKAGSRHFRIFLSPPSDPSLTAEQIQAIASTVIKDTTFALEAGHRYTFVLWGFSRVGQAPGMKLDILDDNPADPGAQVALRVVNAAAGLGAIDARQYPSTGTAPVAATWGNVAFATASPYVSVPTGAIKYNVTTAGSGTALFTDATAIAGLAATVDLDAIPGTTVAGSAVSGFVVPRSVAGSTAASFTTPGIIFLWDRRPPRAPGL